MRIAEAVRDLEQVKDADDPGELSAVSSFINQLIVPSARPQDPIVLWPDFAMRTFDRVVDPTSDAGEIGLPYIDDRVPVPTADPIDFGNEMTDYISLSNMSPGQQTPPAVNFHMFGDRVNWSHRDAAQVSIFMETFPGIDPLLDEAEESIAQAFGRGTEVILEVMTFADEGAEDELVAWICSDEEVEVGLERFDTFDDEWAGRVWRAGRGRFNFNIQFP